MARQDILGHAFISYESGYRHIYWQELSYLVIKNFGSNSIFDESKVEEILIFCFSFLIDKFKNIVLSDKNYAFFKYVFWLHEESIEIYIKWIKGSRLDPISEGEFASNRRILRAILEQGCDIDLVRGKFPDQQGLEAMDEKIHHLLYLGHWIYQFADAIALQKMIEDCHYIDFDENGQLAFNWKYHYGTAYVELMPLLGESNERGAYELENVPEFIEKISECFSIDFNWARDVIFHIKQHHNPKDPSLQTIDPEVLPQNLSANFGIPEQEAQIFYKGLTISRENKLSLEDLILKPHSIDRLLTRPILVYNIDGEDRALVGSNKFPESIMVLATNGLNWNALPREWLAIKCMSDFLQKKSHDHDKLFEDQIEIKIREKDLLFIRNVKSLKQHNGNNVRIDNSQCGEIDFIVVNKRIKKIYVVECKYCRARYEAVGYRTDDSNFKNNYDSKLLKKENWVRSNLRVIEEHIQIIYQNNEINIVDYNIQAVYFLNTPIFYSLNGDFKAIPLKEISNFLDGIFKYPAIEANYNNANGKRTSRTIEHPYFRKPVN